MACGRRARTALSSFAVWATVTLVAVGLGFAVQYGEDSQLGNDRPVSKAIFMCAAGAGFYALTFLMKVRRRK